MPDRFIEPLAEDNGTTFTEFAMLVASSAPNYGTIIFDPESTVPEQYFVERLDATQRAVDTVQSWDDREAQRQADAAYRSELQKYEESEREKAILRRNCEAMLSEVKRWVAPSEGHGWLKQAMVVKLTNALDIDCAPGRAPSRIDGADHKAGLLEIYEGELRFRKATHQANVSRARAYHAWYMQLVESLPVDDDKAAEPSS